MSVDGVTIIIKGKRVRNPLMEKQKSTYPAWTMDGKQNTVVIETIDDYPVRYRIIKERPGKVKVLHPWTEVAELGLVPDGLATSALADLIIDRYDLISEDLHKTDAQSIRLTELIGKGLSPNEADVYARVEAQQKIGGIAQDLGTSQQDVSDALRRARVKMAGK